MKIHFIGCKGVSMSALMRIVESFGHEVSGSDAVLNGHDAENVVGVDLVVYTCAVDANNVELANARHLGIRTLERAEFLGQLAKSYKNVIAVSGCHGKTTATGFLQETFISKNPTVHIGGSVVGRENACIGGNDFFISEACEYKRNFLHLAPQLTIVLNIELDHPDYYKDKNDYESAFLELLNKSRLALINGDDPSCMLIGAKTRTECFTFGFGQNNYYRAVNLKPLEHGFSFDVLKANRAFLNNVRINLYGEHNVLNALSAIAAADLYGINKMLLLDGVNNFLGIKRRFEYINSLGGAKIFCDYAHHPSELKTTILTAKKMNAKKVTICFEPHTYSRTKTLKAEFVHELLCADEIVLVPIFPAREDPIEGVTSQNLARELIKCGAKAFAMNTFFEACDYIFQTKTDGEIIVFTGAGDINKAADFFKNF